MNNDRSYILFKAYSLCDQIYFLRRYPEAIEEVVRLLERLKMSYEKEEQEYVVFEPQSKKTNSRN